jgi:hypothetical protein
MTKHFLVVFDRAEGRLLRLEEFPDRAVALKERFASERLHRNAPTVEVVVLTANSEDALRRSHARYFQDVQQIACNGLRQVKAERQTMRRSGLADPTGRPA